MKKLSTEAINALLLLCKNKKAWYSEELVEFLPKDRIVRCLICHKEITKIGRSYLIEPDLALYEIEIINHGLQHLKDKNLLCFI